jgi:hypothetical protein
LLDVDPGLSQAMRQRILVNFLQMAVAMITMNSERGFSHEITQFVNVVYSVGFHFFALFRAFLRLFLMFSFSRSELGPECGVSAVRTVSFRDSAIDHCLIAGLSPFCW